MKSLSLVVLLLCTSCAMFAQIKFKDDALFYFSRKYNCSLEDIKVFPYSGGDMKQKKFMVEGCNKKTDILCQINESNQVVDCKE